jgi:hypothetical protein
MPAAMSTELSVLPLSATMISPAMPASDSAVCAFSMQTDRVSASLRHGITIDTSTGDFS